MDFLVRFVQLHESFRRPELEALVELYNVPCQIKHYDESVCRSHESPPEYATVRLLTTA